ncbi:MAG: hypothetical protein C0494_06035 [Sphingobium sp.]|nr:hypothetical protein [Sphingobium sp.]
MITAHYLLRFKASALLLASAQIQSVIYCVLIATAGNRLQLLFRVVVCLAAFATQIPLLAAFLEQQTEKRSAQGGRHGA